MQLPTPIPATITRRYKRFLADVTLDSGEEVTAHCPNSGSMKTCVDEGWKASLSLSDNPKRKLPYTLEMLNNGKCWICVNTHRANAVVDEAIAEGKIPELTGYAEQRREVKVSAKSRLDIVLSDPDKGECWLEVKTVTLLGEDGNYQFPDAVSTRALKHLHELIQAKEEGHRAVIFFLVMRSDGKLFRPAVDIDPGYAAGLVEAEANGVEILVYLANVSPGVIEVKEPVPYELPQMGGSR